MATGVPPDGVAGLAGDEVLVVVVTIASAEYALKRPEVLYARTAK